ncbi:MAG: polysaccharide biosynthesis tyrosine autokinase [bacterium]
MDIAEDYQLSIKDYTYILKKRLWFIISCCIIFTTIAAIKSFTAQRVYKVRAQILIEIEPPKILSSTDFIDSGGREENYYATQYEILQSRSLAKIVFDKLNLNLDPHFSQTKDASSMLLRIVKIEPLPKTRLVNITVEGTDPKKITQLANTWAECYIEQNLEFQLGTSRFAHNWLSEQLNPQKEKLENAEIALQKYMEENQLVSLPDLDTLEASGLIEMLRKEKVRLETELSEKSQRYKDKHPVMIKLFSELQAVKNKLEEEIKNTLELNQRVIQYRILKREVEINREMYDAILKRSGETNISQKLGNTNIRIVDYAEVPQRPIRPKKNQNILFGFIAGLGLGIVLSFFWEHLVATINSSTDVTKFVRLPLLGSIPRIKREKEFEKDKITLNQPNSNISEAYRLVRTSLLFSCSELQKSFLVTSPVPGDGKTLTAVNLGITLTQTGSKVVLVDADLRHPQLCTIFNMDKSSLGLSDYLKGSVGLEDIIKTTSINNLSVIPSGTLLPNPAELLSLESLKGLVSQLKERFDHIIFDSPPLVVITDSTILANSLDGVILVIRANRTTLETINKAKQLLTIAKSKIIGVVLNDVDIRREGYYHYSKYYHTQNDKITGEKRLKS